MAQETPPSPPPRGPIPRLVLVPLAVVVAAGVVYLASRPLGGGEPQPSFFVIGSAGPGVQIGQIAPGSAQAGSQSLALIGLDGTAVSLTEFRGRPIWVIFWKTACPPCEAEAPAVAAAYAAHRADRLVVIGVDVWDTTAAVRDYLKSHALDYPIAVATTSNAMDAYGVWGAPTHYFIDRAGIIRDRYFGPMTRELIEKSLRRII
jgi:peroxiredoxin